MNSNIGFASQSDENELREIFLYYDMDLAGDIEEHVILKKDEAIIAGAKLSQIDNNLFHLEVLGVRSDQRGTGAGGVLLSSLLRQPEKYCLSPALEKEKIYRVTTVSRGDAVPFYEKYGFEKCSFSELVSPYDEQCETCPDKEKCQPVPMVLIGGEKR